MSGWDYINDRPARPLSADVAEAAAERAAGKPSLPTPRATLKWVGIDLDGTLAKPVWTPENPTREIGEPIWSNVAKARQLAKAGWKIFIHTSRPWTDYEAIEAWANHYQVPFKEIQCGKPLYAAYIDDRAIHADDPEWFPRKDDIRV